MSLSLLLPLFSTDASCACFNVQYQLAVLLCLDNQCTAADVQQGKAIEAALCSGKLPYFLFRISRVDFAFLQPLPRSPPSHRRCLPSSLAPPSFCRPLANSRLPLALVVPPTVVEGLPVLRLAPSLLYVLFSWVSSAVECSFSRQHLIMIPPHDTQRVTSFSCTR